MGKINILILTIFSLISCSNVFNELNTENIQNYSWKVTSNNSILEISRGKNDNYPQYIALHTNDSYFRMVPSENATWGTSICIMPIFWENGTLYQGTTIETSTTTSENNLIISFSGIQSTSNDNTLSSSGTIEISPPNNQSISATVNMVVNSLIELDTSKNKEAFKFGFLSSMKIDSDNWDADTAIINSETTKS